ncbi:MAG: UDP-glucose 4-epimerase GalE [Clostridia bacterium]|nr:UDP-glucose 4-epimerase GalE [Clostridia bacterium]
MAHTVLLAGGAGFIGSHTAIEFTKAGYDIVIADNYNNSSPEVIKRISELIGKEVKAYEVDVCDENALDVVFAENDIDAVVHFAGHKAVGESVAKPIMYYENNLVSTFSLIKVMKKRGVKNLVFSSSATVYGIPETVPLDETMKTGCTNPYGWTKLMNEQILTDAAKADPELSIVLLRYFNPIGAHESGRIGEDPAGVPNNLFPYITQVAVGKLQQLSVYGDDYDTVDGTGVRDYIHVVDLACGHVAALNYAYGAKGCEIVNLGTGTGYSVLEMVKAFERVNGITVPYRVVDRRPGDVAECYANAEKAKNLLGWSAVKTLDDMCRDAWNWQKNNPNGYKD